MQSGENKRGFKRKTIIDTIEKKMVAWINTLPEALHYDISQDYIVTGGAIVSMLQGDLPNDYDLYFRNPVTLKKVIDHFETNTSTILISTDNAISLKGDIQIIKRFCGSPEIIHENFDFIHTKNYYTNREGFNPQSCCS